RARISWHRAGWRGRSCEAVGAGGGRQGSAAEAGSFGSSPGSGGAGRVLARPGMTAEKFESLKARQLSDMQKRQQAHYVVMTDKGLDHAREQVKMILA